MQALERLADHARPPTAVPAATDLLAFGLLHGAFERGRLVPGHLSVTGFDHVPMSAIANPPLTTLRMPITEMATAAVEQVITRHATTGGTVRCRSRCSRPDLSSGGLHRTAPGGRDGPDEHKARRARGRQEVGSEVGAGMR